MNLLSYLPPPGVVFRFLASQIIHQTASLFYPPRFTPWAKHSPSIDPRDAPLGALRCQAFCQRLPSPTQKHAQLFLNHSHEFRKAYHSITFYFMKKTPDDAVTPQRQSQFTPKMKANAVPRLLSFLVWIDQYNECNEMTSFMECMIYRSEGKMMQSYSTYRL